MNPKEPLDYAKEAKHNFEVFLTFIKEIRPDIYVLMLAVDDNEVNTNILVKVARQLGKVARGTKYGSVTAHIEDGTVTFVRGEESDRINEPIISPRPKL